MDMNSKLKHVLENTEVVRAPRQTLATFGSTSIDYYVVTSLAGGASVVRDGRVMAERPRVVTPLYLLNVEGFSEQAKGYAERMFTERPDEPGIFYSYKNVPGNMEVVSERVEVILEKLGERLEEEDNPLSAILRGIEESWDVSLLVFIYDLTSRSFRSNAADFTRKGFLDIDPAGVSRDARVHIEELFRRASRDPSCAPALAVELKRWEVFSEYQDRFFSLFRR